MPGFDKTGPAGQGPMTGRGMGNCVSGENGNVQRPMGRGLGLGGGRGRGCGNGRGFRNRVNTAPVQSNDQMMQMQQRINQLETELSALRQQNENSDNQR